MSPDEDVRKALHELLEAANTANEAASAFTGEILSQRKDLVSEATIVREAATLLNHVAQTTARTTLAALLSKKPADKEVTGD